MWKELHTTCIIANAFFVNPQLNSIAITDLHKVVKKLNITLSDYNTNIAWTRDNLAKTSKLYSDIFKFSEGNIMKLSSAEDYLTEEHMFLVINYEIPEEVLNIITKYLKELQNT